MVWIAVAPCKDGFIHFSEGQEWGHPLCGFVVKPNSSYVILKLSMIERLEKDFLTCRECLRMAKALFD